MTHADVPRGQDPRRRHGALTLVRDTGGSVLLVRTSYNGRWQLPGGAAHADEPLPIAQARELLEETGLRIHSRQLLVIDETPRSHSGSVEGLNVVFDGGAVPEDTVITLPEALPGQDPELTDYKWVKPGGLHKVCNPQQTARIQAALKVLADPAAAPRYLYSGVTPCDPGKGVDQ